MPTLCWLPVAADKAMLAEASLDVAWPLIEYFTTMVRESGSAEERKTFAYHAHAARCAGVPLPLLRAGAVPLGADGGDASSMNGRIFRAKAQAFSANTPPKGISGEVVYVPADNEDEVATFRRSRTTRPSGYDVRGKIVLTEGLANPECCWDFEERGAIAQVYINPGASAATGASPPPCGACPTWTRWIACPTRRCWPSTGRMATSWWRWRVAGGCDLTVHSLSDHGWKKVPLLVAEIKGTEEPEKFVLAHGHLDSWGVGGGDNAVGNAAMSGAGARVLEASRQAAPQHPHRLVARPLDRPLCRLDLVCRPLRPRPERELHRPGQHRFARLPLGRREYRNVLMSETAQFAQASHQGRDRPDRRPASARTAPATTRSTTSASAHSSCCSRPCRTSWRRRRATTPSAAAAATSNGTRRRHHRHRRQGQPAARHQGLHQHLEPRRQCRRSSPSTFAPSPASSRTRWHTMPKAQRDASTSTPARQELAGFAQAARQASMQRPPRRRQQATRRPVPAATRRSCAWRASWCPSTSGARGASATIRRRRSASCPIWRRRCDAGRPFARIGHCSLHRCPPGARAEPPGRCPAPG